MLLLLFLFVFAGSFLSPSKEGERPSEGRKDNLQILRGKDPAPSPHLRPELRAAQAPGPVGYASPSRHRAASPSSLREGHMYPGGLLPPLLTRGNVAISRDNQLVNIGRMARCDTALCVCVCGGGGGGPARGGGGGGKEESCFFSFF